MVGSYIILNVVSRLPVTFLSKSREDICALWDPKAPPDRRYHKQQSFLGKAYLVFSISFVSRQDEKHIFSISLVVKSGIYQPE